MSRDHQGGSWLAPPDVSSWAKEDLYKGTQRSIALGITRHQREYELAIRVQRPSLAHSALIGRLTRQAKSEVEVRMIGRIDKRAKARRAQKTRKPAAAAIPWYQRNTRPLLIGASVGHVDVTAGTIGAFVTRGNATLLLSNNHVLANENLASESDWILHRAPYDGGREPTERVARLRFWIALKPTGTNFVDAALAEVEPSVAADVSRLREMVNGGDRALGGLGPEFVDEGEMCLPLRERKQKPPNGRPFSDSARSAQWSASASPSRWGVRHQSESERAS